MSDEPLTPKTMLVSTKEKIRAAIEDYCEGIEWLEFSRNDLEFMVDDIERIVESERGFEAESKSERNDLR